MKNSLVLIALCFATSLSAQKLKPAEVPPAVREAFAKAYPTIAKAVWEKEGDAYEVEFKVASREVSVVYSAAGELMETERSVKASEVPAAVLSAIKSAFPGYKLEEFAEITTKGVITYEVELEKGKEEFEAIFDAAGKLIKRESSSEDKKGEKGKD
jgi:hypothetical protein